MSAAWWRWSGGGAVMGGGDCAVRAGVSLRGRLRSFSGSSGSEVIVKPSPPVCSPSRPRSASGAAPTYPRVTLPEVKQLPGRRRCYALLGDVRRAVAPRPEAARRQRWAGSLLRHPRSAASIVLRP